MICNPTEIKSVPHNEHRYTGTVGDYWYDGDNEECGELHIRVSKMSDPRFEFLVQVHEFIESHLCRFVGVKETDIQAFDKAYEARREPSDLSSEPGFDSAAPYRRQHTIATGIETMLAAELGVDWNVYCKEVENL